MRLRSLLVVGAAAALILSGCTAQPTPTPRPSAPVSETPTPEPEPMTAPDAAFDVSCDDVGAAFETITGALPHEQSALQTFSNMNWIPGPAQYLAQRAGGIGCSAGDESAWWEVLLVPDGDVVVAGMTEKPEGWREHTACVEGSCSAQLTAGDVVLVAKAYARGIGPGESVEFESAMRGLAERATSSIRAVEYVDSTLVGVRCERFISEEELSAHFGAEVRRLVDFGGWSVESEVYENVNGSSQCYYAEPVGGVYEAAGYLRITMLPAGAWAFEGQEGTPTTVAGADGAKESPGEHGERHLDVRLGIDWIRITTFDDGSGAPDPVAIATKIVRNFTIGQTAPQ
ncbi:hypothetical protein [Streptomyces sp. AC495_CC817]|uniref:hypothetical protein n=1 Tax=Streptomyces sp. AC495_CC817 TaxID=2823900 RepID=UPI001C257A29|nr:hypothetical protein [Streptomyces sp. AC495_CC817]